MEEYQNSPKVLVLVEGKTEEIGIPEFLRKLGICPNVIKAHDPEKASRIIKAQQRKFDKFILLWDLHEFTEKDIERRYRCVINELPTSLRDRVKYVIAKREFEAWLLADPEAVKKVSGHEVHISNPEALSKPSEELDSIFKRCGKSYVKGSDMVARLAREANLDRVMAEVPSFRCFVLCIRN